MMSRPVRAAVALALGLLFAADLPAVAQNGPPRPPEPLAAQPVALGGAEALKLVRRECRTAAAQEAGAGAAAEVVREAIKSCTKDRIKPFRRACNKEARGQGYAKKTAEFKSFVKTCTGDRLAAAAAVPAGQPGPVPGRGKGRAAAAPLAAPLAGPAAQQQKDDDGDDMGLFDDDND